MKKSVILISILILFLSMSASSAFFGPDIAECKQFSIEVPDGYFNIDVYVPYWESGFYLARSWIENDNVIDRTLYISEVSSFDDYNHSETEIIIENYTDGDIKAKKCYDRKEQVIIGSESTYGANYTLMEFSKDGHNYLIKNNFEGKYEDIDLKKDVELAKEIKKTLKHK